MRYSEALVVHDCEYLSTIVLFVRDTEALFVHDEY